MSGVSSGHPKTEKGKRPLLNQVSSTSGSWSSLKDRPFPSFASAIARASSSVLATIQFSG